MKVFGKEVANGAFLRTRAGAIYTFVFLSLVIAMALALWQGNWQSALLGLVTMVFLVLPFIVEWKMKFYMPTAFSFVVSAFLYATIILGQIDNYYMKYWWWDVMLHSGSGLAFGLVGLIVILLFFKDGKLSVQPFILCLFAFCFSLAVGLLWEVFEFTGDELLHTNMQQRQTGVVDTMKDEIMDTIGAAVAAALAYFYLRKDSSTPLDSLLDKTVRKNKKTKSKR